MRSLIHIRQQDTAGLSAAEKEKVLMAALRELSSVVVALSGGADSAYLAWAAHETLGSEAISVTALSPSFSAYDRTMLEQFVLHTGVHHEFLETYELENPAYRANAPDRCYFCKDELFAVLDRFARERQLAAIAYGMNADDSLDFRPGHRAAAEHHILAPLLDAGLRKAEIRELSRSAGLPTWDRPASACLSSRIPYGTEVTPERLALVERGEAALRELGFHQFRVRLYGQRASVEVSAEELHRAFEPEVNGSICNALRAAGFSDVTLDPKGYRQGSLNEGLLRPAAKAARGT